MATSNTIATAPLLAAICLLAAAPGAGGAVTFTPLTQARTVFASTNADSQGWPDGTCLSPAFDEETIGQGASNFLLYENDVAAAATTLCAETSAAATQSSNLLMSSLVASGTVQAGALGSAIGSSGSAASVSLYDVFFESSSFSPVKIEGFLFAESTLPSGTTSGSVIVQLITGAGVLLYNEEIDSGPDGSDGATLSWTTYLTPGQYRFLVYANAGAEVATGEGGASATYSIRLVGCSPWCTPPNDECWGATATGEGSTEFSTINATDSPDAQTCALTGDSRFRSDVWYSHVAECTGPLTVSTCGSTSLDTTLAVYEGGACPQDPAELVLLGCDDDDCGGQSSVTIAAAVGQSYLVRLGGRQGVQGTGTFSVSCAGLVGDLDGDGDVDGADLGLLLGAWGQGGGDLDGNGTTDGGDLGLLLGAWTG